MTEEKLNKMDVARHLLPPPGDEVAGELIQALRAERERGKALEEGLRSLIGDVEDGIKLREYRKLLSREDYVESEE